MPRPTFDHLTNSLTSADDVTPGNLFGKPCIKVGSKAFCAFFQEEMAFKIGAIRVQETFKQYDGAQNWDPSGKGRPMKDWVQVPFAFVADWEQLALEAKALVAG